MTDHGLTAATGLRSQPILVVLTMAFWLAGALALSLGGTLQAAAGAPPLRLLAAATLPVAVFLLWYRASPAFRDWILAVDLRVVVMLQAWRVVGGVFLVLFAFGHLPGLFAWPAGLGDVAIGLTAPFVALALMRHPQHAAGRGFLVWNLLGIFDFVAAVATGTVATGLVPGLVTGVTSAAMSASPLSLIPGFLVPLFTILHLVAILQARRRAA